MWLDHLLQMPVFYLNKFVLYASVFFRDFSSQRAQLWEEKAHFSQKYILWCDLIRYIYYSDSWNKNLTYCSYWICIERLQWTKLYLWKQEFLLEFPESFKLIFHYFKYSISKRCGKCFIMWKSCDWFLIWCFIFQITLFEEFI